MQTNSQPDTVIQVQEAKAPVIYVYDNNNNYDEDRGCCTPYMVIFFLSFFFGLLGMFCGMACIQTRNRNRAWKYAVSGFVLGLVVTGITFMLIWILVVNNNVTEY